MTIKKQMLFSLRQFASVHKNYTKLLIECNLQNQKYVVDYKAVSKQGNY